MLPPQPVDATYALNLSVGVSNSKVFLGSLIDVFLTDNMCFILPIHLVNVCSDKKFRGVSPLALWD